MVDFSDRVNETVELDLLTVLFRIHNGALVVKL